MRKTIFISIAIGLVAEVIGYIAISLIGNLLATGMPIEVASIFACCMHLSFVIVVCSGFIIANMRKK